MIILSDFNEKKILNLLRKGGGPISENGNEADQNTTLAQFLVKFMRAINKQH